MSKYTRILTIYFKNEIAPHHIPYFRGAVIASIGATKENVIFHNHIDEGFRCSYPLIQYKRIHKKAAIVCINEGCDEIGKLLSIENLYLNIGNTDHTFEIEKIVPQRVLIQTWNNSYSYRLRRWLPLNQENYEKYLKLEGIAEKIQLLESVLTANILSFAKGLDITIEKEITSKITSIQEPYHITFKEIKLMAFDIEFKTNVFLPQFIGLGKSASLGHGIVSEITNNTKTNKYNQQNL